MDGSCDDDQNEVVLGTAELEKVEDEEALDKEQQGLGEGDEEALDKGKKE